MRRLGREAAILAAATAIGQLTVIGRELFVAARTGASLELDALLVAIVVPTLFSGVLFSGFRSALVPTYVETARTDGDKAAARFAGAIVFWMIVTCTALIAAVLLLAGPAVGIAGPGLSGEGRRMALGFLPIVVPLILVTPLSSVLAALCQARDRFGPIALSGMAGSITSTLATIVLWDSLGVTALGVGVVLNSVVALGILGVALGRAGLFPWPAIRFHGGRLRRFIRHLLPLTVGTAVLQFNLLADRAVASLLSAGRVSALRYGEQLIQAPLNIVEPGWGTVMFPALVRTTVSSAGATGDASHRAIRYALVVFMPVSVAIAALAPLVVDLFYRRGAFDASAAIATSGVLAAFAPLLVLTMSSSVLVGAHNARRRGGLMGFTAILNASLNLILDLLLAPILGVAGIALATSIAALAVLVFLAWRLESEESGFGSVELLRVAARAFYASIVPALPIALIVWNDPQGHGTLLDLAFLSGLTILGGAGYLIVAAAMGVSEPMIIARALVDAARARWRRAR